MKLSCYHIHLLGQVQGVGFRPFVSRLAQSYQLNGWVNNGLDGLHIRFNADGETAVNFYLDLLKNPPRGAKITKHNLSRLDSEEIFSDFVILESSAQEEATVLITPDVATCAECRAELMDRQDVRYNYAFITCTYCGPRYSIIGGLPYDRERTAMASFQMCADCQQEYDNVRDRRYFSQTNSCPKCGVQMHLDSPLEQSSSKPIQQTVQWLKQGYIGAIKGVAGYLLMADATSPQAVQVLRERKHRPSKPFALLYPDIAQLAQDAILNEQLIQELNSPVAPIVMVPIKAEAKERLALSQIAPGLNHLGVMLPAAPLLQLVASEMEGPLIATSANISASPICYQEEEAKERLKDIADFWLHHNRKILAPQDDSVLRISPFSGRKIWLRRSRGLAPNFIQDNSLEKDRKDQVSILSLGADLKHAFGIKHLGNTFISPYLGDLTHYQSQKRSKEVRQHLLTLLEAEPKHVLVDDHPAYASRYFGEQLSQQLQIPVHSFGHHMAHFGAVLGENQLFYTTDPILGVIWDGTGYGKDGQVWGGEFFLFDQMQISRVAHIQYYSQILGDKMAKEPRLSALSLCLDIEEATEILRPKFTKTEWSLYQRMINKQELLTSSIGRIFDAVASLLDLIDKTSYEGEAALKLETLAQAYFNDKGIKHSLSADWIDLSNPLRVDYWLAQLIQEKHHGASPDYLAAKFHWTLIELIDIIADQQDIHKIAFSGGVWQNALLVDLAEIRLKPKYQLYFHKQLSPNDENIAYGQLQLFEQGIKRLTDKQITASIHA